mmetsp:Transcript_14462/g.50317  ORF Transcript_14462/g.50317 Transcript_14462/m.50317 type:complete len:272 (-) Transcript_14462:64-879(-)
MAGDVGGRHLLNRRGQPQQNLQRLLQHDDLVGFAQPLRAAVLDPLLQRPNPLLLGKSLENVAAGRQQHVQQQEPLLQLQVGGQLAHEVAHGLLLPDAAVLVHELQQVTLEGRRSDLGEVACSHGGRAHRLALHLHARERVHARELGVVRRKDVQVVRLRRELARDVLERVAQQISLVPRRASFSDDGAAHRRHVRHIRAGTTPRREQRELANPIYPTPGTRGGAGRPERGRGGAAAISASHQHRTPAKAEAARVARAGALWRPAWTRARLQ